jgi:CRP/FNR family cyclic AMP-dependent transcriptional regulator
LQGDPADAVFYIQKGKIKLTVVSKQGKEAVVAILGAGDFFGEGCLAGQPFRMASAATMSECSIMRLEKAGVIRLLHEQPAFSELLLHHLLSRNIRIEEDLVDQLVQLQRKASGAGACLLLANFGKERQTRAGDSQNQPGDAGRDRRHYALQSQLFHEPLPQTGLHSIQRQITGGLEVHSSLLNVILHD